MLRRPPRAALFPSPTLFRSALYEHCLPNALMRRWLEEMRTLRPDTAYHGIDPALLGRPDGEVTDVLDVSGVLDRREAAMAEHRDRKSTRPNSSHANISYAVF